MPSTISESKTLKGLAQNKKPLSFEHIKSIIDLHSPLANYLKAFASESVYYRRWEFDGDSILDDFWTLDGDAGATMFKPSSPQVLAGSWAGATGTTDNDGLSMLGQAIVKGDKRAYLHVHFTLDVVTGVSFEIGFTTAPTDRTLPVVTDVDTPAVGNGGTDLVVVHMDTDQTLQTMALVARGSTTGMTTAQKSNIGTLAPTAATKMCVRVGTDVDDDFCIIDNQFQYKKTILKGMEGGTLVAPWIYFRTRNTTTHLPQVSMVELLGEK